LKFVNINNNSKKPITATLENDKVIERWHRRLCYYYNSNLTKYLKEHGIYISTGKTPKYIECKLSKMKRKPHKDTIVEAKQPLEIIHSTYQTFNASLNDKSIL